MVEVRAWPDGHTTFMMHCVFTGKTQRVLSALSSAESGDYAKVKVLKNYKLVSEAYEQR